MRIANKAGFVMVAFFVGSLCSGMPPDMAISMRHTKLTAKEAALLAGEVEKPNWQSRNEGIHERVSFEDAIWGFDLAGGSFYKTPLRVVAVKPDSRAEKAGIRPGDKLLRINDIDTSTLSIQEAHAIIIESGIHLKIAVTAPEDEEDAYFCYEDPLDTGYDSEEERRLEEERAKKRQVHAKVNSYWSLQWPWVSKRRIIYRESNCFMVPSKYEGKHRNRFTPQPMIRTQDDVVLDNIQSKKEVLRGVPENKTLNENAMSNGAEPNNKLQNEPLKESPMTNGSEHTENLINGIHNTKKNGVKSLPEISEKEEESIQGLSEVEEINGLSDSVMEEESIQEDVLEEEVEEEEISELDSKTDSEVEEKGKIELSETTNNHDEVINEVLEDHDISMDDEDRILNSILSNGDTSESMDER